MRVRCPWAWESGNSLKQVASIADELIIGNVPRFKIVRNRDRLLCSLTHSPRADDGRGNATQGRAEICPGSTGLSSYLDSRANECCSTGSISHSARLVALV